MAVAPTFRFETLLRLRKAKEDERKRVVGLRLRRITALRRRQDTMRVQVSEQTDAIRAELRRPRAAIVGVRWGRHWVGHLRRGILEIEARIAEERALLAQERSELVAVRKETRVLDRLKEKRREAFREEMARREQRETDDVNVTRFVRARLLREDDLS